MYVPAVVTSVLILFVLVYFVRFEEQVTGSRLFKGIVVVVDDVPGAVGVIGSQLGEMGVLIKNISLERLEDGLLEVVLLLRLTPETAIEEVINQLTTAKGIHSIDRLN